MTAVIRADVSSIKPTDRELTIAGTAGALSQGCAFTAAEWSGGQSVGSTLWRQIRPTLQIRLAAGIGILRSNSLEVEPCDVGQTDDADQLPRLGSERVQFFFRYCALDDHFVFPLLPFVYVDHRWLSAGLLWLWCRWKGTLWWVCLLNLHGDLLKI
jgi:hypothetical protein